MQNIMDKKTIIVESIRREGPSLPSALSKQVGLSLLFTSALLSEMVSDKTLKLSYLKIGGSPLYYLPGQEEKLEKYTNYLNAQEKESFEIIKERRIIQEEVLEPVHRVAIKSIKDFASPLTVYADGKQRTFWRLYSIPIEDAQRIIEELIDVEKNGYKKQEVKKTEEKKESEKKEKTELEKPKKERKKKIIELQENQIQAQPIQIPQSNQIVQIQNQQVSQTTQKIEQTNQAIPQKTKKVNPKFEQLKEKIKQWLHNKHLEILQEHEDEEALFTVFTPSTVGNLKFLVVVNDKKKVSEGDLSIAYHKGLHYKMPVIFLVNGELSKKAHEYLNNMGGYINVFQF